MTLENLKNDLVLGTIVLLQRKILVQLTPLPTTTNGIITLPSEHYETDGGKIKTRTSEQKYLPIGVILASSDPSHPVGQKVIVTPSAVQHAIFDPTLSYLDKSLLLITSPLIDATFTD
jgi:hypothetical protein